MTDNIEMNPNEWTNWIKEAISKKHIKYYEYKDFHNIEINSYDFGNVYRVNWKNSKQYFSLKSFNLDNITVKEIIREFELRRKVNFHENIVQFFGITNKESQNIQLRQYLLVMEYFNGGSLRNYLEEKFKDLTWENKYKLAHQLSSAVSHLHEKGIVHCDLHTNNIFVHQDTIKLADFGLSKRIKGASKQQSDLFGVVPYIDPQWLNCRNNLVQEDSLNEKSDVYSIGVILWEISSGQPPFKDKSYDADLVMKILQGRRETMVPDTPTDYFNIYTECWDSKPNNRPTMDQVVFKLNAIINTKNSIIIDNNKLIPQSSENSDNIGISNIINLSHEELSSIMRSFNNMNVKEMEPTTLNIHENIFEEDLSIIIDELVDLYFRELNKGKENNQKAFELYKKAAESGSSVAQFELAYMYIYEKDIDKDYDKAFELSKKLVTKEYSSGINLLGYCYECGFGTCINMPKAFELYQKAANLGNLRSQFNLALMYIYGKGIEKDYFKAYELFEKSAAGDYSHGICMLGYCCDLGFGTSTNKQKAFELYQKAAILGNRIAQYNLAMMYEKGSGIKKNLYQAIYWYKKSAEQGYQNAQIRLSRYL
ncbi:kinase-like domain-containing protein [Rhizophagus irregularis DAOM 181602=DAOM 197198]|nr:kinase-like domain-containing protein [Rhizophagus irregularis DAOM 181602=DAOM 197198]